MGKGGGGGGGGKKGEKDSERRTHVAHITIGAWTVNSQVFTQICQVSQSLLTRIVGKTGFNMRTDHYRQHRY